MYFDLTDEQGAIQEAAKQFLAARYRPERIRELVELPDGFAEEDWKEMTELGWQGLALPEEWGGQGLGMVELAVVMEEMGYALAPSPLLLQHGRRTGARDLRRRRSEGALSSAAGRGRAARHAGAGRRREPGGDRRVRNGGRRERRSVVLDGEKVLVMDAGSADFFLVATSDGGRHIVDRDTDGVSVTRGELDRPHPQAVHGPLRRRRGPGRKHAPRLRRRLRAGLPARPAWRSPPS